MMLTQKRLDLKSPRNSFCIFFPANDIVSYRRFIFSPLHVRWKQLCPTHGPVEGFVQSILSFSCSDKHPTYWQPLRILIIFNLPFLMQAVLSSTLIRGMTRGTIPRAPCHYGGAQWLQSRRKVTTMSQSHSSIHYIYLQNISDSNVGAPNLLLAPDAI